MTTLTDRLAALPEMPDQRTPNYFGTIIALAARNALLCDLIRDRDRPHGCCDTRACTHCDAIDATPAILAACEVRLE